MPPFQSRLVVSVDASFHAPRCAFVVERNGVEVHKEDNDVRLPGFTSNRAELNGLLNTLERLITLGMHREPVVVRMDNRHVVDLVNRDEVKSGKFGAELTAARALMRQFRDLEVVWVPRERNRAHSNAYRHKPRKTSPILTPSGVTP